MTKLLGGLALTMLTLGILIYLILKAEAKRHRRQKELALSCQHHKNKQYIKAYGIANVETKRVEK
jgi:hypothetical protein